MLKMKLSTGETLEISFRHEPPGHSPWPNSECCLRVNNVLYVGTARLHPNDNFSRQKGRKVSLQDALWRAGLTKAQRQEVWDQYRALQTVPVRHIAREALTLQEALDALDSLKRDLQKGIPYGVTVVLSIQRLEALTMEATVIGEPTA